MVIGAPSAVLAIDSISLSTESIENTRFIPFTPANLDPTIVNEVAAALGTDALRFTPAARPAKQERTVTMAVRVDDLTARAISVRSATAAAANAPGLGQSAATIAPTKYNLGLAKGYQGFAAPAPKALELPSGIRDIAMPDLGEFRADERDKSGKPSRFQSRIAIQKESNAGRAPRTLEGAEVRSIEVGGSYRVVGNLNVTAGVRLSSDRDRLDPLTDGVEDSQAVYVGTQFKF